MLRIRRPSSYVKAERDVFTYLSTEYVSIRHRKIDGNAWAYARKAAISPWFVSCLVTRKSLHISV